MHVPNYYLMGQDTDVFDWLDRLPPAAVPEAYRWQIYGIYVTSLRYARRCLWKGATMQEKADDARKAADTFARLACILENAADTEEAMP